MINLPKIKKCPCCDSINFISTNVIVYELKFKSLSNYALKKKFICRKCREEIGLFSNKQNQEKLLWLNDLRCEENYYTQLNKLNERKAILNKNLNGQTRKVKLSKNINEKYSQILSKICDIQKKIQSDKIKLKIKFKIQKRAGIINRLY